MLCVAAGVSAATRLPAGAWGPDRIRPLLDKTMEVRLDPDLSGLTPGERGAVSKLLEAGRIFQNLYEESLHPEAARVRRELGALGRNTTGEARDLQDLYRLSSGPIATTLDNAREPFVAVAPETPGRNFYPRGATKESIERFLEGHPEQRATVLGARTIVRRADAASLRGDLAILARHPALDLLHPGLADTLRALARRPSSAGYYAVPYPVAYADSFVAIYRLLTSAAASVEPDDPAFAGYLRLRARDLLANDYEGGDAAWVTARFGRLNAEIGAYETYDDALFGVKASHGLSVLLEDEARTRKVRDAVHGLQEFEDQMPYPAHKHVREDIPVGVYDVIADFGQARGTNTATILPNDSELARRYGRTILLRRNIMLDAGIVESSRRAWVAVVEPKHAKEYDADGSFQRTLWHEIGHYLGPDRDRRGHDLDPVLQEYSSTFEEMKADLVALFVGPGLEARGYYDAPQLRALYASGVLRMLNKSKPRPDQVYNVMQLMQFNWFLEHGALVLDPATQKLSIVYPRYHDAVASLLAEVMKIQYDGDHDAAGRFIARWTAWDARHDALARAMKAVETARFRLVRYGALGE